MKEAFVLASGPSLTPEDVERVRVWRCSSVERMVVVTNTTFRLAPWADFLFSHDPSWLAANGAEVRQMFSGKFYSQSTLAQNHGAECVRGKFKHFLNSGACAISLAIAEGAKVVYLLGVDCQETGGKKHWHEDHPVDKNGNGNASSIGRWPEDFAKVAEWAHKQQVDVLNCSRSTALRCFPLMELEAVLVQAA